MWLALHPLAEDCSAGGWRLSDAWSLKTSQLKRKKERNPNFQYISTLHADVFILTYSCQNWNYVVQRFYCFSKFKHNITSHWHWKLLFFILDIQNDFQVIRIHISFTCIKVRVLRNKWDLFKVSEPFQTSIFQFERNDEKERKAHGWCLKNGFV